MSCCYASVIGGECVWRIILYLVWSIFWWGVTSFLSAQAFWSIIISLREISLQEVHITHSTIMAITFKKSNKNKQKPSPKQTKNPDKQTQKKPPPQTKTLKNPTILKQINKPIPPHKKKLIVSVSVGEELLVILWLFLSGVAIFFTFTQVMHLWHTHEFLWTQNCLLLPYLFCVLVNQMRTLSCCSFYWEV